MFANNSNNFDIKKMWQMSHYILFNSQINIICPSDLKNTYLNHFPFHYLGVLSVYLKGHLFKQLLDFWDYGKVLKLIEMFSLLGIFIIKVDNFPYL